MKYLPFVSLIIPCLNERNFIVDLLDCLVNQDYPQDKYEIILVDGGSIDGTLDIVNKYIKNAEDRIKLIHNPYRFAPHAFNIGIRESEGEYIFILGAHSMYKYNYISSLIQISLENNADIVGSVCITVPRDLSMKALAISEVLSHPLGVGNSSFRTGINEVTNSDTAPFPCIRKDVFDRFGYFDERLLRNQDIEFSKRIIEGGGKILLAPNPEIKYFSRNNYLSLWENNFGNGLWVILTARYTKKINSLSLRHYIPLMFTSYLFLLLLAFFLISTIVFLPLLLYAISIIIISIKIALKNKSLRLLPFVIITFPILHISYGLGSIRGFFTKL